MEKRGRPSVKLVRGPVVRLEPHPEHASTTEEFLDLCQRSRDQHPDVLLAADLFAGAGGMSLGLEQAGMKVVIGADHDLEALETHRHHFGGLALDWDLGDFDRVKQLASLMSRGKIDVLAGGPPCQPFSKAGRSLMRHLVREGTRDPKDHRRDLWRSYLDVVRLARPRAVIMENVPDMALDREMFILRSMVLELERLGYSVQERVVDTWRYGVPQFRQRLILVAVRSDATFTWPAEDPRKVTVANAISDLPAVDGGWRPKGGAEGWAQYHGPRTHFQRAMRRGVSTTEGDRIYDHITRPVRPDDLAAFELLDSKTKYSELPDELKRYRDDIFDDKYKRLDADDVSRTITAHIAKDGYWYIHPEQNRTITVREAARIQTFPDDFRFAGSPTAAFRQIGNAVPPRLGEAIGHAVLESFSRKGIKPLSSAESGALLADWFRNPENSSMPWLTTQLRWHVLVGEMLLGGSPRTIAMAVWPLLEKLRSPQEILAHSEELREFASWLGRSDEGEALLTLAVEVQPSQDQMHITDDELNRLVSNRQLRQWVADLAMIADPTGEEPVIVTPGALRVFARVHDYRMSKKNRNTNGRIAVARMIGFEREVSRAAQLGLIEMGTTVCTPMRPACGSCPLANHCKSAFSI